MKEGTEYDNDQDVVYPSSTLERHGSDVDSLKVYFSETSSLPDETERLDVWSQRAGSEVAAEEEEACEVSLQVGFAWVHQLAHAHGCTTNYLLHCSNQKEAEIAEQLIENSNAAEQNVVQTKQVEPIQEQPSPASITDQPSDESVSNGWLSATSDQADDGCLSPFEEALYDQVRQEQQE